MERSNNWIPDTVAITEGAIAPDDAPRVDGVDELHTETDLDSERLVLVDDLHGTEMNPGEDPDNGLDQQDMTGPADR